MCLSHSLTHSLGELESVLRPLSKMLEWKQLFYFKSVRLLRYCAVCYQFRLHREKLFHRQLSAQTQPEVTK